MQKSVIILQDVFLNQVRKERVLVTIHLTNGYQIKGTVKGFDNFTIILDTEGKQLLIYKHAVSTISPSRSVFFTFSDKQKENKEIAEEKNEPESK